MQKIANLLTVCNLLSGITTIVFIYANKPYYGLLFVVIAAIFDLMGGPISRYEYIRSSSIKKIKIQSNYISLSGDGKREMDAKRDGGTMGSRPLERIRCRKPWTVTGAAEEARGELSAS
jgi:hypothetical protein